MKKRFGHTQALARGADAGESLAAARRRSKSLAEAQAGAQEAAAQAARAEEDAREQALGAEEVPQTPGIFCKLLAGSFSAVSKRSIFNQGSFFSL